MGVVKYENGAPWQKIGLVFATFNSIANPFVYTMLMPVYRKSLLKTFGCEVIRKKFEKSQSEESVNSKSVTSIQTTSSKVV